MIRVDAATADPIRLVLTTAYAVCSIVSTASLTRHSSVLPEGPEEMLSLRTTIAVLPHRVVGHRSHSSSSRLRVGAISSGLGEWCSRDRGG